MELSPRITIILTEEDLETSLRSQLEAKRAGHLILGDELESKKALMNALPKVISKRLGKMIPDGFDIAEIEFSFSVDAKFWDMGIGGEVKVKFSPDDDGRQHAHKKK